MPREREYDSHANRQAAYRKRQQDEQRETRGVLLRLENAIWEASYQGDKLALDCRAATLDAMLLLLAQLFEKRAGSLDVSVALRPNPRP